MASRKKNPREPEREQAIQEIVQTIRNDLTLEHEPGRYAELSRSEQKVRLERKDNGELEFTFTGIKQPRTNVGLTQINDPADSTKPDQVLTLTKTLKVMESAVLEAISLNPRRSILLFGHRKIQSWYYLRDNGPGTRIKRLLLPLRREISTAFNLVVDRQQWEKAMWNREYVILESYNAQARNGSLLEELKRTNPGAAEWAYRYHNRTEKLNHPGQFIERIKSEMIKAGLHPKNWRFASQYTPNLGYYTPMHLAVMLINAAAHAPGMPSPAAVAQAEITIHIMKRSGDTKFKKKYRKEGHQNRLKRENAATIIGLLLRDYDHELARNPNIKHRIYDMLDYIGDENTSERVVLSTRLNGLMKKSERWHRYLAERKLQEERRRIIEENNGLAAGWNSLVPLRQAETINIVPLTDQFMLFEESTVMKHCVGSLWQRCHEGRSRIFSLRDNRGNTLATMEIMQHPKNHRWECTQVRGYQNAQASQEIKEIANDVARQYQRTWQETPGNRRTIKEDVTVGITV